MDPSPESGAPSSTAAAAISSDRHGFPTGRILAAGLILGPMYGVLAVSLSATASAVVISMALVAGIFLPVMWILARDLKQHGLSGLSIRKLLLVACCFAAVCIVSFLACVIAVVTVWPHLGLPLMPSD